MIYFCADDYGLSKECNNRIESCLENGVLNKISVLANGDISGIKELASSQKTKMSLHINLIEGCPLSNAKEIPLLVTKKGYFKYTFLGLFLLSVSPKRKVFEKQIYKEIKNQISFWKKQVGEQTPIFIDSHQHTHMIPLIFKTLMRVIRDENLNVEYIRIPSEPIGPYFFSPSLYVTYDLVGMVKQGILNTFAFLNRKEIKKAGINPAYFMGVLFSGKMTEKNIKKLLPHYLKLAEKNNKDIEITLHPGYFNANEDMLVGNRKGFEKFYFSPWRKKEFDVLKKIKF